MELARRFVSPYLPCRLQGMRAPGPSARWRHRGSAACQLLHSMLAAARSVLGNTFATGQLMKRARRHGDMEVASLEPRKGHGIPAMQRRGSGCDPRNHALPSPSRGGDRSRWCRRRAWRAVGVRVRVHVHDGDTIGERGAFPKRAWCKRRNRLMMHVDPRHDANGPRLARPGSRRASLGSRRDVVGDASSTVFGLSVVG